MNCREIEKDIYLYDELTATEKAVVDKHILECSACQQLFDGVQATQSIIHKASANKPQIENFGRLTSNIMQAVDAPSNQRNLSQIIERFFIRYAFAGVSLILIISFFIEQQTEIKQQTQLSSGPNTTTLKTSSILDALQKRQTKKQSTSLYACVKSGDCYNSPFKTLN